MVNNVNTPFGNFLLPASVARELATEQVNALMGGYSGASNKRSMQGWRAPSLDADSSLEYDLKKLRDRSSDLIRNNPLATGVINTKVTSVVGSGLKLKPSIKRKYLPISDEQADEWESTAEFEFNELAKTINVSGNTSFAGMQDLAFRSVLEKGDTFALLVTKKRQNLPYTLGVQMIEAERVCNKNNKRNADRLVDGIEKDEYGAPINYHIITKHPGSTINNKKTAWQIVAANDANGRPQVLHLFKPLRPGQTRGIPDLAPVIDSLKQLGRYTEAELMAAVVGGMFSVFIKTEDGDGELEQLTEGATNSEQDLSLGNGAIVGLGPNESIEVANPGRPNQAFDPFVLAILRQIGTALELPYEILIKHFTASYSASRAAMIEAWRFFMARRQWLAERFCQPIYEAMIDEAVAMGRLKAPGYFSDPFIRAAYLGAEWVGQSPGQIDPLKSAKSDELLNKMGVKTLDQITKETTGGDWDANHQQLVKENNRRTKDGLNVTPSADVGELLPEDQQNEGDVS
ncbi:phage portal protein [Methylophaga sp.]|uniref:phage portal protein n=1 Tax=Methylophaga sp. TaxID=2024840 RepID=UPI003A93ABC8